MKVKALQAAVRVATKVSNPASLTPLYQSIEIHPNAIKACSEYGNVFLETEPTGLADTVLVDAGSLSALVTPMNVTADIKLEHRGNKFHWASGTARGYLNIVYTDYQIQAIEHENFPWNPPAGFDKALLLASCACQSAAVSLGLYGVGIEPMGDKLVLTSANQKSLARATVALANYPAGKIALRPPVPAIIASLTRMCSNVRLDITEQGIFMQGDGMKAHLPLGQELEQDLHETVNRYKSANEVANINSAAVKNFITRARALSDKNISFTIGISVKNGNLALEHRGIASFTEEYFIADGLPETMNYESVSMPADMLLLPLESVDAIILDYLSEQRVILRGTSPDFLYLVGAGD